MFNRTHSFTRAVITGGLLSLAVATADIVRGSCRRDPGAARPRRRRTANSRRRFARRIGDDKALAGYVPTLKIIVSDGLVSLKGSVKSEADKKAIGQKVDEIAGAKNVMNNLFVSNETKPAPETP